MARRSLAKRLVRIAQNLQKKTIRLGTRVENKFTTWTHEIAGPEIVASVQGCAENDSNQLESVRDTYIKTFIATIPHRVIRFKAEYEYFKTRVGNPGEYTLGEVRTWLYILLASIGAWQLGMMIGRWNLWGFRYEDETLE